MSDYDPNRLDPNQDERREIPVDRGTGMNWTWVIGGMAAIVLLLLGMSLMGDSQRNAGVAPSQETTGQSSSPPDAAPAEKISPRPATPNQ